MAAIAWYPKRFFRLSFGATDQLGRVLDRFEFEAEEMSLGHVHTQRRLREELALQYDRLGLEGLLRYVPSRLLTPFFEQELRGVADTQKDRRIRELAEAAWSTGQPPLYRFTPDGHSLELHPAWAKYLVESSEVVLGWSKAHWIEYLQRRNPNVPSIPSKISPPLRRAPMLAQTQYWKAVLQEEPLNCIYTGETVNARSFQLDHFVPWSIVCHDQLWNLIPVQARANASKGNRLPSAQYLDPFIDTQRRGLAPSAKPASCIRVWPRARQRARPVPQRARLDPAH